VPVVKCVTSDIYVPADAEYVLEGYLDSKGHVEPEGPYGEYVGYYGVVKRNPVFHLTAITHRKDALFQTVTIGGKHLGRTDTAQLTTVKTESAAWAGLVTAVREPVACFATPSSGGMYNVRVSIRQRVPGEARNAIAAVFGSMAEAKQVFVFDDDIDVFNPTDILWAIATRVQPHRQVSILQPLFRGNFLDPSLVDEIKTSGMIVDATRPLDRPFSPVSKCPDEAMERIKLEEYVPGEILQHIPIDRTTYWA
jgi:2,5-furandicarboxylate decarboxylase 1